MRQHFFIVYVLFQVEFAHSFSVPYRRFAKNAMLNMGIFDEIANALSSAFENDVEFAEKDNPGLTKRVDKNRSGIKVQTSRLLDSSWNITLSLTGIAEKDPSNDLFAPKNALSAIPVNLEVSILKDGILSVKDNDFTVPGSPGKWQLGADGKTLAFSVASMGLERMIVTKGSLQNVYGGEDTLRTSSKYFVPRGTCLIQCSIVSNESGRLFVSDGTVFGKDPRDSVGGKWSQSISWQRTGVLLEANEISTDSNS